MKCSVCGVTCKGPDDLEKWDLEVPASGWSQPILLICPSHPPDPTRLLRKPVRESNHGLLTVCSNNFEREALERQRLADWLRTLAGEP